MRTLAGGAAAADRRDQRHCREHRQKVSPRDSHQASSRSNALDRPSLVRKCAFPAHDLEGRMLEGPSRNFRRRQGHALDQRAAVLEIEVLSPTIGRVRSEANRQDKIDQVHSSGTPLSPQSHSFVLPATVSRGRMDMSLRFPAGAGQETVDNEATRSPRDRQHARAELAPAASGRKLEHLRGGGRSCRAATPAPSARQSSWRARTAFARSGSALRRHR